jgi:predicted O-methyltransferase YrrM
MKLSPKPRSLVEILRSLRSVLDWHALRTFYLAQTDWLASRRAGRAVQFGVPVPWWAYSCTDFLDQVLPTDATVLELGTGGSTLWWLNRGNSVTAVESSKEWAERTRADAGDHAARLKLVHAHPDDADALRQVLHGQRFDVVVVDHSGDRSKAVRLLKDHVADDGVLILDNADRPEYSDGLRDLEAAGFNAFAGVTTVAFRSGVRIRGRRAAFVTVDN